MPKISQLTKWTRATRVVEGLTRRFSPRDKLLVGGETWSLRELVALFESHRLALREIEAARRALSQSVANERAIARRVTTMTHLLRLTVQNHFGLDAVVLAQFGWKKPKKPGPKTVAAKAAGARKGKETRAARRPS